MPSMQSPWWYWGSLALKLIGVAMFAWILWGIDHAQFLTILNSASLPLLLLGTVLAFVANALRVWRWQMLTHGVGLSSPLSTAWRAYNIGLFLATITPAKVGELGRVAYLKKDRAGASLAAGLFLFERLGDIGTMGIFALVSIAFVFGIRWFALITAIIVGAMIVALVIALCTRHFVPDALRQVLRRAGSMRVLLPFIALTLITWAIYFAWCLSFAWAVGITIPVSALFASFTLAAAVAILPIAPSGLGTRDAALLSLLARYGVAPSQAVAVSLLIFCAILVTSIPGAYYWLRPRSSSRLLRS